MFKDEEMPLEGVSSCSSAVLKHRQMLAPLFMDLGKKAQILDE